MDKRDVELRHLRCLVAVADNGGFSDAALELGISQASVSRTLASLESALGARLLYRTSRVCAPTTAGVTVLARARSVLTSVEDLYSEIASGHRLVRVGHPWSALGRHTAEFLRVWEERHPDVELRLVRHNSPTAGLAEGMCDLAVVRTPVDARRYDHAVVGHEQRWVAMASDDPWRRRRSVHLSELAGRTLATDLRTGSTTVELWPEGERPEVEYTQDVDDWLSMIATGRCVGMTPHATTTQYRREGIVYRRVRGADPVAVRLAWHRHDPHPAAHATAVLLSELYRADSSDR